MLCFPDVISVGVSHCGNTEACRYMNAHLTESAQRDGGAITTEPFGLKDTETILILEAET